MRAIALLLCFSATAQADLISLQFEGAVITQEGDVVSVGDRIAGWLRFDPSLAEYGGTWPDGTPYYYGLPGAIDYEITVGDFYIWPQDVEYTRTTFTDERLWMTDEFAGITPDTPGFFDGVVLGFDFTDDGIFGTITPLTEFYPWTFTGELTAQVPVDVPEPGTFALFAGVGALGYLVRKQRGRRMEVLPVVRDNV